MSKWYDGLPSWSKGVVSILGIAVVGYVTYDVIQSAKRAKELKNANTAGDNANKDLNKLKKEGIYPSYNDTQYSLFVQKLVEAMNGCGNTFSAIMGVFDSMKNKADVLSLIKAFGVQFYTPCVATQPISYARYMYDSETFGGGLQTWIQYELSASEISKLNETLDSKKIDIKF